MKNIEHHPKVSAQTAAVLVLIVLLFTSAVGIALYNQMKPKDDAIPEEQVDPNVPLDESNQKFYEVTDPASLIINDKRIALPQGYFLSTITEDVVADATCAGELNNPCKIFVIQSDDFAQTYYISSPEKVIFAASTTSTLRALGRSALLDSKELPISTYAATLVSDEDETVEGYLPIQIFTEIEPKLFITSAVFSVDKDMNNEQIENFITFVQSLTFTTL